MANLPRKKTAERAYIDVEVGDFSHDRLYPDLNPELVGNRQMSEDEYYTQMAEDERLRQLEMDEQFQAMENAIASGDYALE